MTKAPKSTLSKKALRNAAPIEAKPYVLHKRYADELVCNAEDVRRIIKADLNAHQEFITRHGVAEDVDALGSAMKALADWTGGPLTIEYIVDSYTGTRYAVEVRPR